MEENRKKKFRQQVMQRAKKRGNDISPFDANQNSFEVVVTLMPASETLHVANSFFHEKILPAYTEYKSRILKIEHKKHQFYCLACSLSFASAVRPLRVALNSNYYSKNKHLNTFTIYLVNWLSDNGYLNVMPGTNFSNAGGGKRWTRVCTTRKMKKELLSRVTV